MSVTPEKQSVLPSEKELLPLVEGRQVLETDSKVAVEYETVSTSSSTIANTKPNPIPPAKVQLTAPFDLPPGYKLSINYREGERTVHGFCRVPSGGVYAGDWFEAEIVPPRVITGRWAVDLFDCYRSVRDSRFFVLSLCFPQLAWGCLYESAFRKPSGTCWIMLFGLFVLRDLCLRIVGESLDDDDADDDPNLDDADVAALMSNVLFLSIIIIVAMIRWKIRQKYQIKGNCCEDCLCASFCSCCSAMQAYHHMELAQEAPRMGRTVPAMRTPTPKDVVII